MGTPGRIFPRFSALAAREDDGYLLISRSGKRSQVSGPVVDHIDQSLEVGAATPELVRLAAAHPALADLVAWLATPGFPLTREGVVRQDGFDTLFLELLGRCNERCVHCYADSSPTVGDALERDLVLSVIEQTAEAGFRRIQFTGGDPLLCDFLPEAVARAAEVGIRHREIYTNGLALSDALLDQLEPGRPSFAFSFYSMDPEVHDRVTRTPGSHRRTLAAIDRVVARKLQCRGAVVVMEDNADRVEELVEFLKARGVVSVSWSKAFAVGRGTEVATAGTNGKAASVQVKSAEVGGHSAPGKRAGMGKLCVTYTGDLVPCIFQRQAVLGNVKSGRRLVEILADSAVKAGRRGLPVAADTQRRLQCASCRLTDTALGWLRERRAMNASGAPAKLKLRDGLTIRPLPEGDAVVASEEGSTAVIVNAPAHAILDLLAEVRSEQEIAELFCQSFPDQDPAALRQDVAALVAELVRAGIIEPCGAAPSTA